MKNIKVRIGSYDVEISAENWVLQEEGTLNFLNNLAVTYWMAADGNRKDGNEIYADHLDSIAHDLHITCKENGLYEGIK